MKCFVAIKLFGICEYMLYIKCEQKFKQTGIKACMSRYKMHQHIPGTIMPVDVRTWNKRVKNQKSKKVSWITVLGVIWKKGGNKNQDVVAVNGLYC